MNTFETLCDALENEPSALNHAVVADYLEETDAHRILIKWHRAMAKIYDKDWTWRWYVSSSLFWIGKFTIEVRDGNFSVVQSASGSCWKLNQLCSKLQWTRPPGNTFRPDWLEGHLEWFLDRLLKSKSKTKPLLMHGQTWSPDHKINHSVKVVE